MFRDIQQGIWLCLLIWPHITWISSMIQFMTFRNVGYSSWDLYMCGNWVCHTGTATWCDSHAAGFCCTSACTHSRTHGDTPTWLTLSDFFHPAAATATHQETQPYRRPIEMIPPPQVMPVIAMLLQLGHNLGGGSQTNVCKSNGCY